MEPDARTATHRQDTQEETQPALLPAKHFKHRKYSMFEFSDDVDAIFGER
jgi:hypothetical protein